MKAHVISIVILFVLVTGFGYAIHGILLAGAYAQSPVPAREPILFHWLLAGNVFFSAAFYGLYRHWRVTDRTVIRGLTYGVLIWMLWGVPIFLIDYASQPIADSLVVKQLGLEFLDMLAMGVAVALLEAWTRRGRSNHARTGPDSQTDS